MIRDQKKHSLLQTVARKLDISAFDISPYNCTIIFTCLKQASAAEAYSEPCQTSKMERFAKIVNGSNPSTIILKRSILDV